MRRSQLVLLVLGVAGGFALRAMTAIFDAPDALYHLRRAVFAVANFPRTIVFDPMINFPAGGVVIWPPLFDLSLALPALLCCGADATKEVVFGTAIWVPPVYAAMTILLAGLAGLAVHRRWGAAAAIVVAILPGHLEYSMLGRTDQHVAESFWTAAIVASVAWSVKRSSPWLEAVAGVCIAGAVLNWQGGIFWGPVVAIPLLLTALREDEDRAAERTLLLLGLPAGIVAIAHWYWIGDLDLPFTYVSFGWFQPLFMTLVFSATALTVGVIGLIRKRRRSISLVLIVAGLVAGSIVAPRFGPEMLEQTVSGVVHIGSAGEGKINERGEYLSYPSVWLSRIREYDPLLKDGGWSLSWVSFAFFLAPLAVWRWGRRFVRAPGEFHFALLATWGTFIFLFTLSQRRNVYYAAILAALAAVEISAWLGAWLRRRWLEPRQRRVSSVPVFGMLLIVLLLPVLIDFPREVVAGYEGGERVETFRKLGELANLEVDPYDSRLLTAEPTPEIGEAESVMAFWSQGHLATWYAEIPVVANNFGYGYEESLRFFFTESEEEALEIAKRHRVRWVVVFDLIPSFESYAKVLDEGGYVLESGGRYAPTARYFRTLHARLYEADGRGGTVAGQPVEPLKSFRLRWSSRETIPRRPSPIPRFKIFEIVN